MGVPAQLRRTALAETTLCAKYNDIESVKEIFAANKDEIAGVILEPVVGNSGFIAPTQEFLEVGFPLCSSTCWAQQQPSWMQLARCALIAHLLTAHQCGSAWPAEPQ